MSPNFEKSELLFELIEKQFNSHRVISIIGSGYSYIMQHSDAHFQSFTKRLLRELEFEKVVQNQKMEFNEVLNISKTEYSIRYRIYLETRLIKFESKIHKEQLIEEIEKTEDQYQTRSAGYHPLPQEVISALVSFIFDIASHIVVDIKSQIEDLKSVIRPSELNSSNSTSSGTNSTVVGFEWLGKRKDEQINELFKGLKGVYIRQDSNDDLFKNIFNGEPITESIKITWLSKDVLLAYLFEELIKSNLISYHADYNSKIRDFQFFIKRDNTAFLNLKGLKQSYINNKNSKPKGADDIDFIINEIIKIGLNEV